MSSHEILQFGRLSATCTPQALVVRFAGESFVDEAELHKLGGDLRRVVELAAQRSAPLVVSLSGVRFVASAFLGKLIIAGAQAKAAGVPWRLSDVPPPILEVLRRFRGDGGDAGATAPLTPPPRPDSGGATPDARLDDEV